MSGSAEDAARPSAARLRRSRRATPCDRSGRRTLCGVQALRLDDGRRLFVRRWPGQDGTTLVVLHGLLDSSEGWARLRAELSCGVVAFDLPGFGRSDAPANGSIAGYARDIADGLEMLGEERFTLLGHSLGGAIATALAEQMPDKVAGLVLLAPAGFGRIPLAEAASLPIVQQMLVAALPWALTSRAAMTAAYLTLVTNGRLPEAATVDRVTARGRDLVDGTRKAVRAVVDAGRSRRAFNHRRVRYGGPVVAVWGDHDRLVPPAHRNGVLRAFPQAQIELWEGMGHHPADERLDELIDLITTVAAPVRAVRRPPARSDFGLAEAA